MMHYLLYKTTNVLNGKYYIGCHQTVNIDDGYLGSGVLLHRAIRKYGVLNFRREILQEFKTSKEMFEAEAAIVTLNSISSEHSYNLAPGGNGGSIVVNSVGAMNGKHHSAETRRKLSEIGKGRRHSAEVIAKIKANNLRRVSKDPDKFRARMKVIGALGGKAAAKRRREMPETISDKMKESRRKFGKSNLGRTRIKVKCPYCEIAGAKNVMVRFHFEKCKNKTGF